MNSAAERIKDSLTMFQVAEFYGFKPDRTNFIQCPFHKGDRTASLKVYSGRGGFYCFGCHAHGSVIDFTMLLFGCDLKTALQKLNSDFDLGLYRQTYRERKSARKAAEAKKRQLQELEEKRELADRYYWSVFDRWRIADMMKDRYAPSETNGEILPGYAEAVKSLPQLSYELLLAEERRRELDNTSRYPGMEEGRLPNN